jgi:hypothetical protein
MLDAMRSVDAIFALPVNGAMTGATFFGRLD